MLKVPTVFDRDWEGDRGVIPKLLVHPTHGYSPATEKLNGSNVRVTVRTDASSPGEPNSLAVAVRLEKRRNPTKEQKRDGITEPWYVDASRDEPADRFLFEALDNTPLLDVPEGEWSAEAVGPKVQGNPLKLEEHRLFFFDLHRLPQDVCVPVLDGVPVLEEFPSQEATTLFFHRLYEYLRDARSMVNPEVGIEGIVWHGNMHWAKIKRADFKGALVNA